MYYTESKWMSGYGLCRCWKQTLPLSHSLPDLFHFTSFTTMSDSQIVLFSLSDMFYKIILPMVTKLMDTSLFDLLLSPFIVDTSIFIQTKTIRDSGHPFLCLSAPPGMGCQPGLWDVKWAAVWKKSAQWLHPPNVHILGPWSKVAHYTG